MNGQMKLEGINKFRNSVQKGQTRLGMLPVKLAGWAEIRQKLVSAGQGPRV